MHIVISAHFDIARPIMFMQLQNGKLNGLVDNFAGVFVAYQVNRKTGTPVYLTNYEELDYDGAIDVAKQLDKETCVVVIDTIKTSEIGAGKVASVANNYNLDLQPLKDKLGDVHFFDEYIDPTEDETWIYGNKYGLKTFYFGIPIPDEYHSIKNSVEMKTIDQATKALIQIIELL